MSPNITYALECTQSLAQQGKSFEQCEKVCWCIILANMKLAILLIWIYLHTNLPFSPVFNYCLPAAWHKGTSLRDKLLVFVCRDFVFVLVLVVYLYEINYPDLSDCLYLLWPGRDVIKISTPAPGCTAAQCYFFFYRLTPAHLFYRFSNLEWYWRLWLICEFGKINNIPYQTKHAYVSIW